MNKNKPVRNLLVGESFTLSSSHGTVYTVTRPVRTGDGLAVITYRIGDSQEFEMYKAGLTTAQIVR